MVKSRKSNSTRRRSKGSKGGRRMSKNGSGVPSIEIVTRKTYDLPTYGSINPFLPGANLSMYVTKQPYSSTWSVVPSSTTSNLSPFYVSKLSNGSSWWAPYVVGRRTLYGFNDYTTKRRRNRRRGKRAAKGKRKARKSSRSRR